MTPSDFVKLVPLINGSLSSPENTTGLHRVLNATEARLVVEVGSFLACGSTRVIGEWMREHGGNLICVDTLCVDVAARGLGTVSHPHAFYSNLAQLGLKDIVTVWRGTSAEAAAALQVQADVIYIDAGHSEADLLNDVRVWVKHLREGGRLCGDDANQPTLPGVDAALLKLQGAVPLYVEKRFWWTAPLTAQHREQIARAI